MEYFGRGIIGWKKVSSLVGKNLSFVKLSRHKIVTLSVATEKKKTKRNRHSNIGIYFAVHKVDESWVLNSVFYLHIFYLLII